jgi:hypothetical protein
LTYKIEDIKTKKMDTFGNRDFVASTGGNYMVIIDLKTLDDIGHFEIGGPDGLAWANRL